MKMKPVVFLALLSMLFITGCSSKIQEIEDVKNRHNREVEFIIGQQEENIEVIENFNAEVIEYLKGNILIASVGMSKIQETGKAMSILKDMGVVINGEIEKRAADYIFLRGLEDVVISEEEARQQIRENYFNEIREYIFQDTKTGEMESVIIYMTGEGINNIFSITWLEQKGYSVEHKILN